MNTPQTQNPVLGTMLSIVAFITGKLPETKIVSNVTESCMYIDPAMQDLITFYFSNIAFLVSIIVGLVTFRNYIHKRIKKHHAQEINRTAKRTRRH